ncbi:ZIP family metal transporter [Ramlibacter sp. PS4R-6]|uniref:ZIP family metal transporter n=1 Tax=Ramlibacter sp. PS4R-6 TaxID=3133438 RepID=UPI0030A8050F
MTFIWIVIATLAAGIGSVWLAAGLARIGMMAADDGRATYVGPHHLLSLAAGALLATAFMQLLPEAFESNARAHALFTTLLVGLVFFFLLDKAELWHHGHEHHHEHGEHDHHHHHDHDEPRSGAWAVLTGDSLHCFGDGVMIASAFVAHPRLGWAAALAVLAHEVPHHIGDLAVVRMTSASRRVALVKVSLAGAVTVLGGVAGYLVLDHVRGALPYFLVVASSSFIYVALADLIPQLQRRLSSRETIVQVAWLLVGIAMVTLASQIAHQ